MDERVFVHEKRRLNLHNVTLHIINGTVFVVCRLSNRIPT